MNFELELAGIPVNKAQVAQLRDFLVEDFV